MNNKGYLILYFGERPFEEFLKDFGAESFLEHHKVELSIIREGK